MQKVEGNPDIIKHSEACIQIKKQLAHFILPPGADYTTSDLDTIVLVLGDSGMCFSAPVAGPLSEKSHAAMNNSAVTHAIKADTPTANALFVQVQPGWTIYKINDWLLETFGADVL